MSLQEGEGSAAAGNPTPTDAGTVTNGSSGGTAQTNWWDGLQDEGNRTTVDAKGWRDKGPDALVGDYRQLERKLTDVTQKALTPPSDDAKPEEWDSFFAKLGRPEKPEGYDFRLPEGLPEAFPYDDKSATSFKLWAHAAGLTPRQAQAVHDQFVKHTADTLAAKAEDDAKAQQAAHEALVKAWGDPASETYKRNQELANRTLRQQGGEDILNELKGIGALGPNGEVKTPRLATLLSKVGEALYAEDTLYAGPGGTPNPFSDKSENMAEQGKIIRSDPDRARALIKAAGKDPAEWRL